MAVSLKDVTDQLLDVLRETFEGPRDVWSYFTDNTPEAGLFGTLNTVGAAEASRMTGKTSIAAHVRHVVFALDASTAWISGDRSVRNWKESWRADSLREPAWRELLGRLEISYRALRNAIEEHALATVESMGGALGALAHAAYHLGAIRQKIVA